MYLKTIRFLSRMRAKQHDLRQRLQRLRKAYDALDKYCAYLIGRVRHLEVENGALREEVQCKTPSASG